MAFVRSHARQQTAKQRIVDAEHRRAVERAEAREELKVRLAREDSGHFVEYVLRNEADGSSLRNAPFHWDWHKTLQDNEHVVLIAPVEHAKSQAVSVGRALFELGKNPSARIALISSTEKLAKKLLKQIRAEIERNPRLHRVFPHLRRSLRREDPWTSTALTVERQTTARDPSVQVLGAFGAIVGSRLDIIILDDVLSFENTRTEEQRKKLIEWFDTTVYTRGVQGAKVFAIGTPWHPEDLLHELSKRPAFTVRRYSAVENPDDPPRKWRPIWPDNWPLQRLLHRRANMPEAHFIRKYLCRVRLDTTSRFQEKWLKRMCQLGKGRVFELAAPPRRTPRGPYLPCFTGVDLGVGSKSKSNLTVICTIALLPGGLRLIVNIESGRWQAPEILARLRETSRIYRSEILVESNVAQKYLVQMAQVGSGKIENLHGRDTTAQNKFHEQWGVEALATELQNMLWVMPSGANGDSVPEEGQALISECLHYDPEEHAGDRLMAMWLARESARLWGALKAPALDTQRR